MDKEMKQNQAILSSIVISVQQDVVKQRLNYYKKALCSEGNQCHLICGNKQCKNHAIVCADRHCKCYQVHFSPSICSLVYPQFFFKKIEQARIQSPWLLDYIDTAFQKLIDQISEFRDELQNKAKSLGLTKNVRQFLQISQKGQFRQLTGQTVSKVLEQINKESKEYNRTMPIFTEKLEFGWNQIEEPIKQLLYSFQNVINQCIYKDKSFLDSKILSNYEQRKRVVQFFPQEKRKFEAKLLYRASENQFQVSKFHEKCDGIPDTVTVVKTQFNKVIGGYTPLSWKGRTVDNKTGQQDITKSSFMFSVTTNHKFTITPGSRKQILHYKQQGPVFWSGDGYADLYIKDKANNHNNSFANINNGYSNPKYKADNKATWELFLGQTDGTNRFKIIQWQVYQLIF